MRRVGVVLVLALLCSACTMGGTSGTSTSSTPIVRKDGPRALSLGDNANCETKDNSGGPCETIPDPEPEEKSRSATVTAKRTQTRSFEPWMCGQGAHMVGPMLGIMMSGQTDELVAFCDALEAGEGGAVAQQSYPEGSSVAGGCVWKGRAYKPGDRIHHNNGTIYAGDLFVHGQRFDILSDVGRGPNERFQACECGKSSGVWGCV